VKASGFGTFLDLKLETACVPKTAVNIMKASVLIEDHIAIKVLPDVTLNFNADVVEKLTKAPRGKSKLEDFTNKQSTAEYTKLRDQLGVSMNAPIHIEMLLEKLKDLKDATEVSDKDLKLRIFYLILISNFLLPTNTRQADKKAVWCTRDIDKIAEYNWCEFIYQHFRELISTKDYDSRTLRGCIIALLVSIYLWFHCAVFNLLEPCCLTSAVHSG
jgi:hypothetical protein